MTKVNTNSYQCNTPVAQVSDLGHNLASSTLTKILYTFPAFTLSYTDSYI